jgi:hypothetical protein
MAFPCAFPDFFSWAPDFRRKRFSVQLSVDSPAAKPSRGKIDYTPSLIRYRVAQGRERYRGENTP